METPPPPPPPKWRTISWFLIPASAAPHMPLLVKNFLAKKNVTTLEHPPYSSDLATVDFHSFLLLKSAFKGWNFCDANYIIQNATEELKKRSQIGFQECLRLLYSRWHKWIFAQGGLFERKSGLNVVPLFFFGNKANPRIFGATTYVNTHAALRRLLNEICGPRVG